MANYTGGELLSDVIRRDIQIPALAEQLGYTVQRHGRKGYNLKEHDSLVISNDGLYFTWNSQQHSGTVIDFYAAMMGVTINEAISSLRKMLNMPSFEPKLSKQVTSSKKEKTPFEPPKASSEKWSRLYAYLSQRGISKPVIDFAVKNKYVYQDEKGNVCFSGKNYEGKEEYVSYKSSATGNKFRGIASGSNCDLRFSINLTDKNKGKLFVCEAGVDVLSIMTLLDIGMKDFTDYAYLSLDGTDIAALKTHIENNSQINTIYLCQDNDEAGLNSAKACLNYLKENGFKGSVILYLPKEPGYDYNDQLLKTINQSKSKEKELCQNL